MTARVEEIAWGLLGVLNRLQAKGSLVRIVVPRDMEVARELHFDDPDTGAIQDSSRIHCRLLLLR
jgi:hypothetical protein